jgi:hypothetical protein
VKTNKGVSNGREDDETPQQIVFYKIHVISHPLFLSLSYSHCRGSSLPVFKSASVLHRTSSPVLGASPSGLAGTIAGGKGAAASLDAKGKGGGKKRKSEAADKQPKTAGAAAGEDG